MLVWTGGDAAICTAAANSRNAVQNLIAGGGSALPVTVESVPGACLWLERHQILAGGLV